MKKFNLHSHYGSTDFGWQGRGSGSQVQYFDSTTVVFDQTGNFTLSSYSHLVAAGEPRSTLGEIWNTTQTGPYALFDNYVVFNSGRAKMTLGKISGEELIINDWIYYDEYLFREVDL